MWNVNPDRDKSLGGFQDRDLGKTQFNRDYGPDFGVDYARFSDPPDFQKDHQLQTHIHEQLTLKESYRDIAPTVRNGFVILKGKMDTEQDRYEVCEFVRTITGVVEVIDQISLSN